MGESAVTVPLQSVNKHKRVCPPHVAPLAQLTREAAQERSALSGSSAADDEGEEAADELTCQLHISSN